MGLTHDISPATALALDTNISILSFEADTKLGHLAKDLFAHIDTAKPRVSISVLVFHEFLIGVYKMGLERQAASYEDFLTGGGRFTVVDFNRDIARVSAKIRAKYPHVRSPDSIHLASAIVAKAKVFVTADRRLPRKVSGVEIRVLK